MIQEILNSPIFGILVSIIGFEIGLYIYRKTKIALFNPLLICIALIVCMLISFNIKLDYFDGGGKLISFFLGPATVVLAVPLYKKINVIKQYAIPILLGVTIGSITAILSIFYLCKAFGLTSELSYSLVPKSITTPIGIEVSKVLGGIPAITVSAIIITGIMGAVIAPIVCKIFKIKNPIAIGISIGTASHAIGTTKAIEMGETQGAMSSLAIGIAGLITSFLAPIIVKFLH
ncbi:putative murein hydrolase (TIGR00659 family) [Clostridium tetanomorphum]|uniref:LrgB family protein n=1 Tax=Clostridium tetanomorphum TaxID=1553 RepID=A0A923EAK2_CLOTT|nr:LrgB family protein [Clostridium tetanomorphum]KAJ53530.1 lrga-associated membrane protein LrgB [Clostridium tetanomorphum DSM 665]MBC2396905.1 LrgB family protein [Clostridium tetanomorphum]MBP1863132.1 putative murein hydrolase (TIGR00659 family) [Clostridium tetanomorphum]NRS84240.1 putative murein hydrolase (TIGR00659 family) [Clostridium tetanomorphum]NRZ97454.1 putative murein hydrolase (TIGR00659 family) [Clostridium tetanomorphum]